MGTIQWESFPAERVRTIENLAGPIVKAETVPGGLMPGLAAVIHTRDSGRYFLKAAPADSPAYHLYAREMAANAALPEMIPAPRMRWSSGDGGWAVMLFDCLDARTADLTPGSADLPAVLALLRTIGYTPARDGIPPAAVHVAALREKAAKMLHILDPGPTRGMYAAAVEGFDPADLEGNRLVHYDLHPGNLKIDGDGEAVAVDWAFACAGAPWIDAAFLVPRLIVAGHAPDAAERLAAGVPWWQDAPADAVTGLAALWTMFREYKALYGPPDAREPRARAAAAGQAWIRYRTATRARR